MENKIYKDTRASALLVAMMLMGILMTLSLGISSLVMGTLRDSRSLLEKTRAWYAAESGLEQALFAVSENAPGFEAEKKIELGNSRYEYRVRATASEIPQKKPYEIATDEDRFAALHHNESITIPLFRGSDPNDSVKKLRVEYYLAPDLKLRGSLVDEDLDILRWKIFGIAADGAMEVMNEFVPMQAGKNSAGSPSCLGTGSQCWNGAKFYERAALGFHIVSHHPITTFLEQHTQNFLVLTNMVNVDVIAGETLSTAEKKQIANIQYRVIEEDGEPRLTLPSIKISADGFAGESKQSLDLEIKRESFLPVFHYALYRTAE
jgi:hypothetical protein